MLKKKRSKVSYEIRACVENGLSMLLDTETTQERAIGNANHQRKTYSKVYIVRVTRTVIKG